MNPVIASVFVGVITYLGSIARKKPLTIDVVVGIAALALALAMIEQANRELARKFAVLVVIATLIAHWKVIVDASGLAKKAK